MKMFFVCLPNCKVIKLARKKPYYGVYTVVEVKDLFKEKLYLNKGKNCQAIKNLKGATKC